VATSSLFMLVEENTRLLCQLKLKLLPVETQPAISPEESGGLPRYFFLEPRDLLFLEFSRIRDLLGLSLRKGVRDYSLTPTDSLTVKHRPSL